MLGGRSMHGGGAMARSNGWLFVPPAGGQGSGAEPRAGANPQKGGVMRAIWCRDRGVITVQVATVRQRFLQHTNQQDWLLI